MTVYRRNLSADVRKQVNRTTWGGMASTHNGEFILHVGNHFYAVRKQDGDLEINLGNRRHTWENAALSEASTPVKWSLYRLRWMINPALCDGIFQIDQVRGSCRATQCDRSQDCVGGSLADVPAHVIKDIVRSIGDLWSVVQAERVCREARNTVTDASVWAGQHVGIIPAKAMQANWLTESQCRLARAFAASLVVSAEWPFRTMLKVVCGSALRSWRSRGTVACPIYIELSAEDAISRCVISIANSREDAGLLSPGARCWCQLNNPCDDLMRLELGHSRLGRPSTCLWNSLPVVSALRLIQVQWWNDVLTVFADGHGIGSLSLSGCDLGTWSEVSVTLFSAENAAAQSAGCKSRILPTDLRPQTLLHREDRRGGCLDWGKLPQMPAVYLSNIADIFALSACNSQLRQIIQEVFFWHGLDLDLTTRSRLTFLQSEFLERMLQIWSQSVRSVICPHVCLHFLSALGDKLWLRGTGEYLPCLVGRRGQPPAHTSILYWKTDQQTCHRASLQVYIPEDAQFLVLALRRAECQSTPENSTCMVLRKPCTSQGRIQFRLADGERVPVPTPQKLLVRSGSAHTFQFDWSRNFLDFSVDGVSVGIVPLTNQQSIDSWVRTAAMCVASPDRMDAFAVTALPFQYNVAFGYPACAYCAMDSIGCCRDCEHWFCQDHGVLGTDICLGCVPEAFLEDRLGGSSVPVPGPRTTLAIERRRLEALRKQYLRFDGQVSDFEVLCDRMQSLQDVLSLDVSDRQPSGPVLQTAEARNLWRQVHMACETLEESVFLSVRPGTERIANNASLLDFNLGGCLPISVRQWAGPRSACVAIPSSFNVERLAGTAVLDILALAAPHPRDADLQFRDVDHTYTWQGRRVSLSVTALIHSLGQRFDSAAVLEAMRGGRNWPRAEYMAEDAVAKLRIALASQGSAEVLLQRLLDSPTVDLEAVCYRIRDLIWTHPGYGHLATVASLSDVEILRRWDINRRRAAAQGTWMHALCECLLNGGSVPVNSPEMCMFLKFLRGLEAEGWILRRTEWTIYADKEDLAGSIDAVAERGSDVCILDWKRTKQLASKDCSFGRRLRYPLDDTPDSVLWHYRIQLNVYAWILRQYYNVQATDLRLVCLHPDNVFTPLVISVPLLSEQVDRLMSWRRQELQSCTRLTDAEQTDLRGGSQGSSSPGFSQRVEDELVEIMRQREEEETFVEPPAPKRPRADENPGVVQRAAASVDSVLNQFMDTDIDPAIVPQEVQSSIEDGDILQQVQRIRNLVRNFPGQAHWSAAFCHVVEGALAVHRLRLLDVSRREEVLFLELIEGCGRHIRAHEGQCFFYSTHGYWAVFTGVIPQGTLAHCKSYLIHLEGLYAKFGPQVRRDEEGILAAAQALVDQYHGSCEALLSECSQAAICRAPTKGRQAGREEDEDAEVRSGSFTSWTMAMANTIGKLYVKLHLGLGSHIFPVMDRTNVHFPTVCSLGRHHC